MKIFNIKRGILPLFMLKYEKGGYMNILLVEDNLTIVKGLKYAFEKENFNFYNVGSVNETISFIDNNKNIDLFILDITLPDGNGINLFESYIKKLNIPTVFLTAKDDEETIVKGLNEGAEDYITKPFSTKELLARVNKIILRNKKKSIIEVKNIKFDLDKMCVYKNDKLVNLTALELKILELLFQNLGKNVDRNIIIDKIYELTGNDVYDHTVTVYIKRIKDKLDTDIIITLKGLGYMINEK